MSWGILSKDVSCPKCSMAGVWVDHGPIVGRGWHCRRCVDDIDHADNVYGLTAAQIKKAKSLPINVSIGGYDPLTCARFNCKHASLIPDRHKIGDLIIQLNVGDTLRADHINGSGGFLKLYDCYKVAEILPQTIRIWTGSVISGLFIKEMREYTRCRFSIIKKVP